MSESKKKIKYLTKQLLVRKSTKAFQEASEKAMNSVGYIIIARDGWIIKEFKDGKIEQLVELEGHNEKQELTLD